MRLEHIILVCALLSVAALGQPIVDLDHTHSSAYRVNGKDLDLEEAAAAIRSELGVETDWWHGDGPSTVITFRCSPDAPARWIEQALTRLVGATANDSLGGLPITRINLMVAGSVEPMRISVLEALADATPPTHCLYVRTSKRRRETVEASMNSSFKRRDTISLGVDSEGAPTTEQDSGFPSLEAQIERSSAPIAGPVFLAITGELPIAAVLPLARHIERKHAQPVAFESLSWEADTTLSTHLRGQRQAATGLAQGGAFATRNSERTRGSSQVSAAQSWLAAAQREDGTWGDENGPDDTVELTGLALLAFIEPHQVGKMTNHRFGAPYSDTITAGLEALMKRQDDTGRFDDGTITGHAIATLTMIQAHRFSGSGVLKMRAQRALTALGRTIANKRVFKQQPSLAGWAARAILAAERAGLEVPARSRAQITKAMRENRKRHTRGKNRSGASDAASVARRTCERAALVCLAMNDQGSIRERESILAEHPLRWSKKSFPAEQNYFTTYMLFACDGPAWKSWRKTARDVLTGGGDTGSTTKHGLRHSDVRTIALDTMTLKLCGRDRRFYPPESTKRNR